MPFITPNAPDQSYLFLRVQGVNTPQMPLGGALPQSAIDAIETSVRQGAQNN
jgi:hypothetical protein